MPDFTVRLVESKMPIYLSLDTDFVLKKLQHADILKRILFLDKTTSTNDIAKTIVEEEGGHGTLIIAEEQTAGRGRKSNKWISARGKGLYFTLILGVPVTVSIQLITLAAGVAVAKAICSSCSLSTGLKWPNDVYIGERKVAGILTEAVTKGHETVKVLVGVGINVNNDLTDFDTETRLTATSLKIALGIEVPREEILVSFVEKFDEMHRKLLEGDSSQIVKEWLQMALYKGEELEVQTEKTSIVGKFVGVNEAGALIIRDHEQNLHEIWAVDVIKCRKTSLKDYS